MLSWSVLLLLAGAVAAAVVVPRLVGGQAFGVLTGSMRPTYPPGSLVVTRPVDPAAVAVGSVITYQLRSGESAVVTHRVVAVSRDTRGELSFRTRGDANGAADPAPVRAAQLRGEVWYAVPLLGRVNRWLTGRHRLWLGGVVVAGLLAYATSMFAQAARERR